MSTKYSDEVKALLRASGLTDEQISEAEERAEIALADIFAQEASMTEEEKAEARRRWEALPDRFKDDDSLLPLGHFSDDN